MILAMLSNTMLGLAGMPVQESRPVATASSGFAEVAAPGRDDSARPLALRGDPDRRLVYLSTDDGRTLRGRVLGVADGRVELTLPGLGGKAEVSLEVLTPSSQYVVMREYLGESGLEARLRMAGFARERKMYDQAVEQYDAALALDPENRDEIERARREAREQAGQQKLSLGKRLLLSGEARAAEAHLREAAEQLDDAGRAEARELLEQAVDEATAERAEKRLAELDERYQPAVRAHRRGQEALQQARLHAGDLADSEDFLLEAVDAFQRALERLDQIRSRDPVARPATGADEEPVPEVEDLRALRRRIDEFEARLRRALVGAYVDLGHHYIVAGDILEAHRYVGLARSLDLDDPRVRTLRRSVAAATARDRPGR
jgi:tetratricopeptide (TPR) repeat protein